LEAYFVEQVMHAKFWLLRVTSFVVTLTKKEGKEMSNSSARNFEQTNYRPCWVSNIYEVRI